VQNKLVHRLVDGSRDQQYCKVFMLRSSRKDKCVFQIETVVSCKRSSAQFLLSIKLSSNRQFSQLDSPEKQCVFIV